MIVRAGIAMTTAIRIGRAVVSEMNTMMTGHAGIGIETGIGMRTTGRAGEIGMSATNPDRDVGGRPAVVGCWCGA
jgi:hypothetical protein